MCAKYISHNAHVWVWLLNIIFFLWENHVTVIISADILARAIILPPIFRKPNVKLYINDVKIRDSYGSAELFAFFFSLFSRAAKNMPALFTLRSGTSRGVISVPLFSLGIAWQNLNLEYSIIPSSFIHVCACGCARARAHTCDAWVSMAYRSKAEFEEGSINDAVVVRNAS